jgi:hypothetical protein
VARYYLGCFIAGSGMEDVKIRVLSGRRFFDAFVAVFLRMKTIRLPMIHLFGYVEKQTSYNE